MRTSEIRIAILGILALSLLGCNIGVNPPSAVNINNAAAGTIVALTLQAATKSSSANTPVAFASPLPATLNASKPILTINNPTNCRSGPGQNFQLIIVFDPGTTVEILGKDSADNYWLVRLPNGIDTCWASGQYSTASGGFASLPEVTPTAGAVGNGLPARPGSLFYNWVGPCNNLKTSLSWADVANNEAGYHVFRNGTLVADLPPNSSSYSDTASVVHGSSVTFSVEAYNQAGVSPNRSITFACQ